MRRYLCILSLFLLVAEVCGQGVSFEGRPRWGLNNTIVLERINRLSVLVANNTDQPFDGTISLHKEDYANKRMGARLVEPVYLTPFTKRWVHFHCYVGNENHRWKLRIGRGLIPGTSLDVDRAKIGPPARMFLREAGSVVARGSRMISIADDEFPTSIMGLDTLHSLVMAHAPEWEPARKQAFRDWVYRGGEVHLFKDAKGTYPQFRGAELNFLNAEAARSTFGAGRIARHDKRGHEATNRYLENQGYPAAQLEENNSSYLYTPVESIILMHLRRLVLPDHNWGLLFFVAIIYLVLIGPLNYVFARRWVNHYMSLGAFLGCVLIFCLIFMLLGRRGFGEKSGISYLSYVQPLDENRSDLTQWNNVFSTTGKTVEFTHKGAQSVFSTCNESEGVPGVIVNGAKGVFQVEMPIFSSMSFLARTTIDGPALAFSVDGDASDEITDLRFRAGPDMPETMHLGRLVYQDRVYELKRDGEFVRVGKASGKKVNRLIDSNLKNRIQQLGQMNAFVNRRLKKETKQLELPDKHEPVFFMVMERVLGANKLYRNQVVEPGLPDNLVRLFILADSPEAFDVNSPAFKEQTGMMIFHQDILL